MVVCLTTILGSIPIGLSPVNRPHLSSASALLARSRQPTADELAGVPWLATLTPEEARVAAADLRVLLAEAGEYVCRVGRPVTFWFGSWDGDLLTGWMQGTLSVPFLPR